jgi:hypothetical protein
LEVSALSLLAQAELVHVFEMIEEEYAHEGRPLPPDVPSLIAHTG